MPHGRPSKGCQTILTMAQPFCRSAMAPVAAMANSVENLFPRSLPWMHGKHPWAGLRPRRHFGHAGAPEPEAACTPCKVMVIRRCTMALAAAMANSLQNLFPQSLPWMHGKHPWAGLRSGWRSGHAGAPRPGGCMHAMENHGDRMRQRPSRWPQAIAIAIPRH